MPRLSRQLVHLLALLPLGLAPAANAARWIELSPADTTRPLARGAHSAVLDEPGRRLIVWSDRVPPDVVWALPLDGPANWTRLLSEGTPPARRQLASTIFDPVRRRMVIFGGGWAEGGYPNSNEVWTLALDGTPRWTVLAPEGTPPDPIEYHTAIHDPVRDRMLVFGGLTSSNPPYLRYENSVWELSLSDPPTWRLLTPAGTPPSPRLRATMVYDATRDRALLFGGLDPTDQGSVPQRNDVWELTLGSSPAWRKLAPSGAPPWPRDNQTAVMDVARNQMLVFGGRAYNAVVYADAWALDLGVDPPAWRKLGPDAAFPRYHSVAVVDPATHRLIVDGGFCASALYVAETIALDLESPGPWQVLDGEAPPSAPPRRVHPVPLLDPVHRRLIVEGGYDRITFGEFQLYPRSLAPDDLWAWPLDSPTPAWTRLPGRPGKFTGPGRAVFDPVRRRQVRFFQDLLPANQAASVGVSPVDGSGEWTALSVQGEPPPVRYDFSTAYDPVRDRILLAGGYIPDRRGYSRTYVHDVWSLSLSPVPTWTMLRAHAPDEPRLLPEGLFFDPAADRFVAVGWKEGWSGTFTLAPDGDSPWQLTALLLGNVATATFDAGKRELVGFSTYTFADAWHHVLSDTVGWVELDVAGEPPPLRSETRVEFDPVNSRVLLFGGNSAASSIEALGDLWALELDRAMPGVTTPGPDVVRMAWSTNLAPGAGVTVERRLAGEDWIAVGARVTDASGVVRFEDSDVRPDLVMDYRLRFAGTVLPGSDLRHTVAPRPSLALDGARPNPVVGPVKLALTLTGPFPARLEVFDLAGRLMESRAVDGLGAGTHVVGIERRLAPGLYVAVLSQSGQRLTRRFVVVR